MRPARSRTRALRVGVVLSDTVIAEHVVRSGTAFTIGQSIRNLVPLPLPGLPRRWQLLELVEHGVLLRLGPGMGARVASGGHVLGRADLDQRGAATRAATLVTVPIGSHGKLELGEVTILFQELELPVPAPAPALPRAVRGTLAERIDRRMATFAAASLVVHIGIMAAATMHDGAIRTSPEIRAHDFAAEDVTIVHADDPALDLEPPKPDPSQPAIATAPSPRPRTAEPARPASAPRPRPAQPLNSDPGALQEDATRYAEQLFASSTGPVGGDGEIARRAPGRDLDKQVGELVAANAQVSIGRPTTDRGPGDGQPRIGTIGPIVDPVPTDLPPAEVAPKKEKLPKPPTFPPPPPPPPGFDVAHVMKKIRETYSIGMQRCHGKALLEQPGLTGKVALTFTLTEKGKVEDGAATGLDGGLESCIEGLMTRWSFAPVLDEDGDPAELDLELSVQFAL